MRLPQDYGRPPSYGSSEPTVDRTWNDDNTRTNEQVLTVPGSPFPGSSRGSNGNSSSPRTRAWFPGGFDEGDAWSPDSSEVQMPMPTPGWDRTPEIPTAPWNVDVSAPLPDIETGDPEFGPGSVEVFPAGPDPAVANPKEEVVDPLSSLSRNPWHSTASETLAMPLPNTPASPSLPDSPPQASPLDATAMDSALSSPILPAIPGGWHSDEEDDAQAGQPSLQRRKTSVDEEGRLNRPEYKATRSEGIAISSRSGGGGGLASLGKLGLQAYLILL